MYCDASPCRLSCTTSIMGTNSNCFLPHKLSCLKLLIYRSKSNVQQQQPRIRRPDDQSCPRYTSGGGSLHPRQPLAFLASYKSSFRNRICHEMPVVQLVMHFPDLVIISLIAFHELCTGDHKEMSSILAD